MTKIIIKESELNPTQSLDDSKQFVVYLFKMRKWTQLATRDVTMNSKSYVDLCLCKFVIIFTFRVCASHAHVHRNYFSICPKIISCFIKQETYFVMIYKHKHASINSLYFNDHATWIIIIIMLLWIYFQNIQIRRNCKKKTIARLRTLKDIFYTNVIRISCRGMVVDRTLKYLFFFWQGQHER